MPCPIGFALSAAGQVSMQYANAIVRNPNARLVGLTSRNSSRAEALAQSLGLDCTIYPSYEALLDDSRVEAVAITTPNYLHAPQAVAACQAGKHVILEKPPAISHEQCDALEAAVVQSGIRSVVSFVLRWNPLVLNLRGLTQAGALGEIVFAQTDYWHGAGAVINADRWIARRELAGSAMLAGGSHAVDMIRFLVGDEVLKVAAFATRRLEGFEFDTTHAGLLHFAGGSVGRVSACLDLVAPYQFNIELLGTEGTARGNRIWSRKLTPQQSGFFEVPCILPDSGDVSHHPFSAEVDAFVECLRTGCACAPDILDGLRTVRVCLALDEAARTGQVVEVRQGRSGA